MTDLLVTGGAGFIGANFVHRTLELYPEYSVTVVDALTYAGNLHTLDGVKGDIEFVHGDICDEGLMDKLVADTDVVVHFAAESHVDNSIANPGAFVRTNILGTFSILEAVRKHEKRLHHISTDEVFGELEIDGDTRFTEETAYDPSSPYSATKASSDMLVRAWMRSYGVEATISNCANNYGPFQHVEKFIPRQITNILLDQKPKLYGSGEHVREWTHVDDHNDAVHLILKNGRSGETYVIGSGNEESNITVLETILKVMGRDIDDYDHVTDRAGHDMRYATDSAKVRKELGWTPQYHDLGVGIASTVAWYVKNTDWWLPEKAKIEASYAQKEEIIKP